MRTALFRGDGTPRVLTRGLVSAVCVALGILPMGPAFGQTVSGANAVIQNGKQSGITTPGFRFEPEVPFDSLKSVPTWNELEQLLDNPYRIQLCSTLPLTVSALIRNTPGNDQGFASYCSSATLERRQSFGGVTLPPLIVNALNYNPTTGEEMRLLNPYYPGGTFSIPDELVQDAANPNRWYWTYKPVTITPGSDRIAPGAAEIDYNAPIQPDILTTCITTTELFPPESSILCGGDPGEPNYLGFGIPNPFGGYSIPAVPLSTKADATGRVLFAPGRTFPETPMLTPGVISPRNSAGQFGLRKPSLRVATAGGTSSRPNYLKNSVSALATDPTALVPSNENDYVRNRNMAIVLGKSLFWDMQVGSDGVQSCGSCHFTGAGTDTRTKNQINPNHLGGNLTIQLHGSNTANQVLTLDDFPLHKLKTGPIPGFPNIRSIDIAGDPKCLTPILASVSAGILENNFPGGVTGLPVCDAANIVSDIDDVVSSMGVRFNLFSDIAPTGGGIGPTNTAGFLPAANGVRAVKPEPRISTLGADIDPIPVFRGFRRVEPRNTPTMQAAGFNFDNFWDGRARHDFNGGSVFGAADPQAHVFVDAPVTGDLVPTRQIIRFSSIASLATGPGLSEFEMSFLGRNWQKIGKKLLQAGVTPLANQLVDTTDSVLGPYSNQGGSACLALATADRSGGGLTATAVNKPGLCISYPALIKAAFYPTLWQNTSKHLNGCYTGTPTPVHPANQWCTAAPAIPILASNGTVDTANTADPFDGYVLTPAAGAAVATNTNQFTQMEGNFSLFWGLGVSLWVQILVPDNTPLDQFLERNPDAFAMLGEPGETGLVEGQLNCTSDTQRYCFREFGNFKRDTDAVATINATGEGNAGAVNVPSPGSRVPGSNTPNPLLGLDIFFSSNLSLKNPNFRTGRCGECHAIPTLTDHTTSFTTKSQLRDFVAEFVKGSPGLETSTEPLGRLRVISGFLLESELNENGQDGVERRIINQSIVPCPTDGLAYPGGLDNPEMGSSDGYGVCGGAGAAFFDNGIYNLGVRPISEDIGRGGDDAFGWPLSLAALMLKNLGGTEYQPGVPLPTFSCLQAPCDEAADSGGGLFEETAQDQQLNPGIGGEPVNPKLPPYLAPWANQINVGDAMPDLDEVNGGVNTLTNIAMLEGFGDTLGPFNPAGILNEELNFANSALMGTWPVVNRVGRMGSFKAPQLRNVEMTGPYFHNGGKATLRQVVDFYVRGGDFPMTNAAHRDFNMVNMNIEVQSNLTEEEKVALVDFLLELTDERTATASAPFDHPQVIIPLDGAAPDNIGRSALLTNLSLCSAVLTGATVPGSMFCNVPAVGASGQAREARFLNVTKERLVGDQAFTVKNSHYSH